MVFGQWWRSSSRAWRGTRRGTRRASASSVYKRWDVTYCKFADHFRIRANNDTAKGDMNTITLLYARHFWNYKQHSPLPSPSYEYGETPGLLNMKPYRCSREDSSRGVLMTRHGERTEFCDSSISRVKKRFWRRYWPWTFNDKLCQVWSDQKLCRSCSNLREPEICWWP